MKCALLILGMGITLTSGLWAYDADNYNEEFSKKEQANQSEELQLDENNADYAFLSEIASKLSAFAEKIKDKMTAKVEALAEEAGVCPSAVEELSGLGAELAEKTKDALTAAVVDAADSEPTEEQVLAFLNKFKKEVQALICPTLKGKAEANLEKISDAANKVAKAAKEFFK